MTDFAAAVTCIDGRFHEPLVRWIRDRFGVAHVDLVTAPGVSAALAAGVPEVAEDVEARLAPSLGAHDASVVVVAAHAGCAGDPCDERAQLAALPAAVAAVRERIGGGRPVVGVRLAADGSVTVAADAPMVGQR